MADMIRGGKSGDKGIDTKAVRREIEKRVAPLEERVAKIEAMLAPEPPPDDDQGGV